MSLYAKAAKNIKSKKFSATNLLCYSEFVLQEGTDLYKVNEAEDIDIFYELREDIEKISLAHYFCELLLSCITEVSDTEEILRLTLNSLYYLCKGEKNIYLIKSVLELKLMCSIGFLPSLVCCSKCNEFENGNMYFNITEGTILCEECLDDYSLIKLSSSALASLRHITYSDFNKLFNFTASDKTLREVSSITEKYVISKIETNFKTLNYFNSIRI